MRLQYSINQYLQEIWPYDPWSRKEICKICEELRIEYTEVPTTMGTQALKFLVDDFKILTARLQKI